MMKQLYYCFLLAILSLSFVACETELGPVKDATPVVNKNWFFNMGTNNIDTLYSLNEKFYIHGVSVDDKDNGETLSLGSCYNKDTELKNGEELIGRIEYNEDDVVTLIEVFNVCKIKLIEKKGAKTAYEIIPYPDNSRIVVSLGITNKRYGASVNIYRPQDDWSQGFPSNK